MSNVAIMALICLPMIVYAYRTLYGYKKYPIEMQQAKIIGKRRAYRDRHLYIAVEFPDKQRKEYRCLGDSYGTSRVGESGTVKIQGDVLLEFHPD